jgi:signal-transduction protein with cAMP-binding, CBS, and nucleotidyltransferase domain
VLATGPGRRGVTNPEQPITSHFSCGRETLGDPRRRHCTPTRAPVFHLMDYDALRLFAFAGEHRTLRTGEVLFREGDKSDGGFVVMRGAIVVVPPGGHQDFVAEAGALVGQTALFSRTLRRGTATAREFSTVLRISLILMRRVLQEFPSAAEAIQRSLSVELSMLCVGLDHVRQRLLEIDTLKFTSLHEEKPEATMQRAEDGRSGGSLSTEMS